MANKAILSIRLTEKEKAVIQASADKNNLTVTDYIKHTLVYDQEETSKTAALDTEKQLEQEVTTLQKDIQGLTDKISHLNIQADSTAKQLDSKAEELDRLQQELQAKNDQIKELHSLLSRQQVLHQESQKEKEQLRLQIDYKEVENEQQKKGGLLGWFRRG